MPSTTAFDHLPLRAQKKAITHAALVEAAQRRFLADGFAATTLEDICSDVRVHVRTLLRYFKTKEELALAPEYESLEQLRTALANRGDRRVLDVFRDRLDEVADALQNDRQVIKYTHFVLAEPSLAALRADVLRQHEDVLFEALRDEVGAGRKKALRARLLAAMLIGGMRAVAGRWVAEEPGLSMRKAFGEVVDEAQGAFEEWRR